MPSRTPCRASRRPARDSRDRCPRDRRRRGRRPRSGARPGAPARAARPGPCRPTRCTSSPPTRGRSPRRRRPARLRRTAGPRPRRRAAPTGRSASSPARAGRTGDRPVDGLQPGGAERVCDAFRGDRGDRVEIRDERRRPAGSRSDRLGDLHRRPRRHDREHDIGLGDEPLQPSDVLERRLGREPPRARAPPVERDEHPRPALPEPCAERASHRTGSDEPDDQRAREDSNLRPAD